MLPLEPLPPKAIPFPTGAGPMPTISPASYTAPADTPGTPAVTIPVVEAVAAVTMSPFVRGALVGAIFGAAGVGALWWLRS